MKINFEILIWLTHTSGKSFKNGKELNNKVEDK